MLQDNIIGSVELKTNSVINSKINNGAVTEEKIAFNSISQIKMKDDSVGTDELKDNAVFGRHIFASQITDRELRIFGSKSAGKVVTWDSRNRMEWKTPPTGASPTTISWSPSIVRTQGGATGSVSGGGAFRIGNIVFFRASLRMSDATGWGNLWISLPYGRPSGQRPFCAEINSVDSDVATDHKHTMYVNSSGIQVTVRQSSALTNTIFQISGCYIA